MNAWRQIAQQTPAERNRVVDLVRAAALTVVVLGHWLKNGLYVDADQALRRIGVLERIDWTPPITWPLQVMPLFFVVGGFANALSWRHACRSGTRYGAWLRHRTRRLTRPLVPLLALWVVLAPAGQILGWDPRWNALASSVALVPAWFLAVYLVVVAGVPWTHEAWTRWRWRSIAAGVVLVAGVDLISVALDRPELATVNVFLVWGTMHQCGYAWLEHQHTLRPSQAVLAAAGLAAAAVLLAALGPYGPSMVGTVGPDLSNSSPPRLTLLCWGLAQLAGVLALEGPLRRLATHPAVWTGVVALNARAMTVYLWHMSALAALAAVSLRLDGVGLSAVPGTEQWWLLRPAWFLALAGLTAAIVTALGPWESRPSSSPGAATPGLRCSRCSSSRRPWAGCPPTASRGTARARRGSRAWPA